jgi:hypothetical protein
VQVAVKLSIKKQPNENGPFDDPEWNQPEREKLSPFKPPEERLRYRRVRDSKYNSHGSPKHARKVDIGIGFIPTL